MYSTKIASANIRFSSKMVIGVENMRTINQEIVNFTINLLATARKF